MEEIKRNEDDIAKKRQRKEKEHIFCELIMKKVKNINVAKDSPLEVAELLDNKELDDWMTLFMGDKADYEILWGKVKEEIIRKEDERRQAAVFILFWHIIRSRQRNRRNGLKMKY